ncbi:MAG: Gfo/Idh/MocA family oxidoreductase [Phycisphaerae bacterium]|nr:Gfo/Idh/MocA family oxidoreductase [Phycisphaerae bacterium]
MSKPRGLTRRGFLARTATGAGVGFAAPYVLTGSALGNASKAPANSRVTLGFVGVRNMGGGHLNGFLKNRRVEVLAVCDVDRSVREGKAQQVKEAYELQNPIAAYNDFRELCARNDIDAVVIATPDHWHTLVCLEACRAGKDIYCEKPLTLTIGEGKELVKAVRRYGRVFQVGSQQRSDNKFRFACELVRSGRIGRVHTVITGIGGAPTCDWEPETDPPDGLDWDFWLGPAPYKPYTPRRCHYEFRWIYDYSGGKMTDWGAHHNDIAQWGLGMDGTGPIHVDGQGSFPDNGLYDTPTSFNVTYTYANGVKLLCQSHALRFGITFQGTDGWVWVTRNDIDAHPKSLLKEKLGAGDVHLYKSNSHHNNWLDCIEQRHRPICDVEIGHRSVTVCHLGNISMRLGRPIRWDPNTEQIVGDDEAARWVDKPMRAPWHL